ncbi:MAG: methionyl-tRNA formyltransferase [Bacilli bacterium]|nr:methionyl-tRNA formyltransferase [Bacilli bacterium]
MDKEINKTRIVYMGTPEISATVLSAIVNAGYNVVGLVTNEDKEVGRKRILEPTPTKKVALANNIPVFQPHRIRLDNAFLQDLKPDLIITMAYGQIVPSEVLNCPKLGCINLHASLLPKYRGAAPMQRCLIDGESKTVVALMEMVEAMDAGRVYDVAEISIEPNDNYTSLSQKVAEAAAELIVKDIPLYVEGKLPGVPQDETKVTIAAKIKPEDEHLDLSKKGNELVNYIRGLSETPGAYLFLGDLKLKIYQAHIVDQNPKGRVGEIVKDVKGLYFNSIDSTLSIDVLQLEGKKKMDAKSFVNGCHGLLGQVLK